MKQKKGYVYHEINQRELTQKNIFS